MKSMKYFKELESYSTIRELAARLPTFYSNEWRECTKKLEAKCGEYSFENFDESTQEASLDANHSVFSHNPLTSTRKELAKERKLPVDKMRRGPEGKVKRKRHYTSLTTGTKGFELFKETLKVCMSRGICFSYLTEGHTA